MAEQMNSACSNKILKILEEPPNKTLIILVSEDADKLLDTIKSRCQIVHLNRVINDEMQLYLKNNGISQEQAESIASLIFRR